MARGFLSLFLLSVLSATTLCAIPLASRTSEKCPYRINTIDSKLFRIPMDEFGTPSAPWLKPFPRNYAGRCLSWNANNNLPTFHDKLKKRVCDSIKIDKTSKYGFKIHTTEIHRNVRDTKYSNLYDEKPRAVIQILDGNRLIQWIEYKGEAFQTNKALQKGTTYKISIVGRWRSFTLCTMSGIACNNPNLNQCGFLPDYIRNSLREYSPRKC